jgi:hypothetical protein
MTNSRPEAAWGAMAVGVACDATTGCVLAEVVAALAAPAPPKISASVAVAVTARPLKRGRLNFALMDDSFARIAM